MHSCVSHYYLFLIVHRLNTNHGSVCWLSLPRWSPLVCLLVKLALVVIYSVEISCDTFSHPCVSCAIPRLPFSLCCSELGLLEITTPFSIVIPVIFPIIWNLIRRLFSASRDSTHSARNLLQPHLHHANCRFVLCYSKVDCLFMSYQLNLRS